jgi:prepilin-type N-terminal cleavage/methylation domain-containing protein
MKQHIRPTDAGFTILELMIAMTITLVIITASATLLSRTLTTRLREHQKTEALSDTQRAINIMSREIANSGFGLNDNGLVLADCNNATIHVRANLNNSDAATDDPGEDVTYQYDATAQAIIRYDRFGQPRTTSVASRITQIRFLYTDYVPDAAGNVAVNQNLNTPSANTGRVTIILSVDLPATQDQPATSVALRSDVTLRNSTYMLSRY